MYFERNFGNGQETWQRDDPAHIPAKYKTGVLRAHTTNQ